MMLEILVDKPLLSRGLVYHHPFDFVHCATFGGSGTGKTFLNRLIAAKIALNVPDSQITILDFKADDYHCCRSIPSRLFEFEQVKTGLEQFYAEFLSRQQGKSSDRSYRLIVIEELGSMLGYFSKPDNDKMKTMIGNLVFLGRSFNTHCLISSQRVDSSYFSAGVRDSINCVIALGNLSKEGKGTMFSGFQDEMTETHGIGSGYMLLNNAKLFSVAVPQVMNIPKLEHYIRLGVTRGIDSK